MKIFSFVSELSPINNLILSSLSMVSFLLVLVIFDFLLNLKYEVIEFTNKKFTINRFKQYIILTYNQTVG